MLLAIACEISVRRSHIQPIDISSKWRRTNAFASSVVMLPKLIPSAKEQSNAARTSTDDFPNRLFSGCFRSRPP